MKNLYVNQDVIEIKTGKMFKLKQRKGMNIWITSAEPTDGVVEVLKMKYSTFVRFYKAI